MISEVHVALILFIDFCLFFCPYLDIGFSVLRFTDY